MPRNVEIKARVNNLNEVISKAKNLCGTDGKLLKQSDTFFNVSSGRLKLRQFEDGCDSQLIYYNRPDIESIKTSEYSICYLKNPTNILNVLEAALGVKGTVKKTRYLFLYGQTRIHIDQVENLGNYFELEVVLTPDQAVEEGEEIAVKLMQEFNISTEDLVKGAYLDHLLKHN